MVFSFYARMKRALISSIFFVTLSIPSPSLSWKVDVHIWIAAQVLKDVQNRNNITLVLDGGSASISLPPERARAVRNHPRTFLLGSIGPDAFPDVWGGQIVIHPSFPGGWGTHDWLRHLMDSPNMSDEELEFVLGYFIHASADTFSHMFENRYARVIFDITEHPAAAIRHIAIESLVSNYLPPINILGLNGSPSALVRNDGRIDFPEELILDRLLFNPEALDQMKMGGAPHFAAA